MARQLLAFDLLVAALMIGGWTSSGDSIGILAPLMRAGCFAAGLAISLIGLNALETYAFPAKEAFTAHIAKVAGALGAGAVVSVAVSRLAGFGGSVAYLWAALSILALIGVHASYWALVRRWRKQGRLTPNLVIVGATAAAEQWIIGALASRNVAILGIFDDRASRRPAEILGVPVLGDTHALMTHKVLPYVDRIVISVEPSAEARVRALIDRLRPLPNPISLLMEAAGPDAKGAAISRLAEAPLAQNAGPWADRRGAPAKRAQDVVLGLSALVAAAPAMAVIALLIKLDSPGPVFFRQPRHGFNNEIINVWKFRSMRHEAADLHAHRQVSVGDDRVTRIGRVIRALSLDELPQFFNVVRGEMSLVGPRPHAIGMRTAGEEAERLVAEYAWRHRMKPGITGWAQINGSVGPLENSEAVRRRVALDIDYIERHSFFFDLYILMMTPIALFRHRAVTR